MSLLFAPPPLPPPPTPTKRNKTGIKAIIDAAIAKGQKVTLEEAIDILRANW